MPKKIPVTISEEELIKIIRSTKKKHHRIAFILGFYGCMRVSEVVKLRQEDIDRGQRLIRIKEGKGKKDRNIPIPPQAVKGLSHIPVGCSVRALQISVKNYAKRVLGREDVHFHTLRHSGASFYLNKRKWSTRQVQVMLGHSRLETTQIYLHVSPTDLISAMWGDD